MKPYHFTKTRASDLTVGQTVNYGILWDYSSSGWRTGTGTVVEVLKFMARVRLEANDAAYMEDRVCLFCESRLETQGD